MDMQEGHNKQKRKITFHFIASFFSFFVEIFLKIITIFDTVPRTAHKKIDINKITE